MEGGCGGLRRAEWYTHADRSRSEVHRRWQWQPPLGLGDGAAGTCVLRAWERTKMVSRIGMRRRICSQTMLTGSITCGRNAAGVQGEGGPWCEGVGCVQGEEACGEDLAAAAPCRQTPWYGG